MKDHAQNIVKSSEVIGVSVKDLERKDLGTIEEIVIDKLSGQVRYVVLSFGGFMGFGDKFFAFPWKSISYSKEDECFLLSIDKSKLNKAHGFDKNNWPSMAQWADTIDVYYV